MQHHAYFLEGSQSLLDALVEDARTHLGFVGEHSPDVHVRAFEKFGIDESRWLTDVGALKSASGRALFVLGIASITPEAQQALLKLLEEPQEGSIYVVLVPHGVLLPTVRSRMMQYTSTEQQIVMQNSLARESLKGSKRETRGLFAGQSAVQFLKLSGKDRSDFITKLLKDDEGTKERVRDFINALEVEIAK